MSELSVGTLSGLAANSYEVGIASGSTLDLANAKAGSLPDSALAVTPGLKVISRQDFTGVSSVSFNDVFTSEYDIYRIHMAYSHSGTTSGQFFRFRKTGTDNSTANYYAGFGGADIGSANYVGGANIVAGTWSPISRTINASHKTCHLDVYSPTTSINVIASGNFYDSQSGNHYFGGINFIGTPPHDGFTILTSTGTINGFIEVYGYEKG